MKKLHTFLGPSTRGVFCVAMLTTTTSNLSMSYYI